MPPKRCKATAPSGAAAAAAKKEDIIASVQQQDAAASGPPPPCSGCGKECNAADLLQCPTCRELKLPASFFCNQDCFTACWPSHKKIHDVCCLPSMRPDEQSRFRFTGELRPGLLSPKRSVPKTIPRPDYAIHRDGRSATEEKAYKNYAIPTLNASELDEMRKMCRQGRDILNMAIAAARPGVTTDDIDRIIHDETVKRGLYPSTLNYSGYKKSYCSSINEVVCHGIPDSRPLKEGDILNLDISAYNGALHADLNETIFIGKPDPESIRLVFCAFEAMVAGMTVFSPGNLYKHVGEKIQQRAALDGFEPARSVYSHGVGKLFHSPPDISHYYPNKSRGTMSVGHCCTCEPMINAGCWQTTMWPDDWTVVTADGKRSAQFENSLAIVAQRPNGSFLPCEILTSLSAPYLDKPHFMTQLEQWGIAVPKSRLPEMGLPEPVFAGPVPAAPDAASTTSATSAAASAVAAASGVNDD